MYLHFYVTSNGLTLRNIIPRDNCLLYLHKLNKKQFNAAIALSERNISTFYLFKSLIELLKSLLLSWLPFFTVESSLFYTVVTFLLCYEVFSWCPIWYNWNYCGNVHQVVGTSDKTHQSLDTLLNFTIILTITCYGVIV